MVQGRNLMDIEPLKRGFRVELDKEGKKIVSAGMEKKIRALVFRLSQDCSSCQQDSSTRVAQAALFPSGCENLSIRPLG